MDINEIQLKVRKSIELVLDNYYNNYSIDQYDIDKTFSEFGLDSLDIVEIVMNIEQEFNIPITDETLENCKTPNHFIKAIESVLNKRNR